MPATVKKNTAITAGQTLGQPLEAGEIQRYSEGGLSLAQVRERATPFLRSLTGIVRLRSVLANLSCR